MIVGANVKAARTALGMTQEDLAKKAGYKSYISIQKIEYGVNHPPVDKIIDLAEALNVSYNYLIGESPDMKRTLMDEIWKNVRRAGHVPALKMVIGKGYEVLDPYMALSDHERADVLATISMWADLSEEEQKSVMNFINYTYSKHK